MREPICWAYIAGFFDGEGCVYKVTARNNTVRVGVAIYQARRNNRVLREIGSFLESHQIACHVNHTHPRTDVFKPTKMSTLNIRAVESVKQFLTHVLPYLRVKQNKVRDSLEYIVSREWRTEQTIARNVDAAIADYLNGMGGVKAATKHGTSFVLLVRTLKERGLPVRDNSASKKLWWSKLSSEQRKKCCASLDEYRNSHLNV